LLLLERGHTHRQSLHAMCLVMRWRRPVHRQLRVRRHVVPKTHRFNSLSNLTLMVFSRENFRGLSARSQRKESDSKCSSCLSLCFSRLFLSFTDANAFRLSGGLQKGKRKKRQMCSSNCLFRCNFTSAVQRTRESDGDHQHTRTALNFSPSLSLPPRRNRFSSRVHSRRWPEVNREAASTTRPPDGVVD
jgi:hypothetical protein